MLAATVAGAALTVLTLPGAGPAEAFQKPTLKMKPGQTMVFKAPSPTLEGKVLVRAAASNPTRCRASVTARGSGEWCDSYPVEIDASDDLIKSGNLQLNATLAWTPGTTVQNCQGIGNCGTKEMGLALWQDPALQTFPTDPNTPVDTATSIQGGLAGRPDTPMVVSHIGAGICAKRTDAATTVPKSGICRIEYILAINYLGSNPYTLTIELRDNSGAGPVDLSAEDFGVFDESASAPPPAVSSTPSAPITFPDALPTAGPTLGFTPIGTGAPRVDLPGLGSSAGFDGIGPAALPSSDLAQKIVNRGPKVLGAPGEASMLVLVLWLVLLPVGGLASFLFYVWRRRREDEVVPVTA